MIRKTERITQDHCLQISILALFLLGKLKFEAS